MVVEVTWKSRHTFENKKVGAKDRRTKKKEHKLQSCVDHFRCIRKPKIVLVEAARGRKGWITRKI